MPPGPKELADFPKLVRHEFTVKDKTDIVFSGLGWIRVQGKADQPTIVALGHQKVSALSYEKRLFKHNKVAKSIRKERLDKEASIASF